MILETIVEQHTSHEFAFMPHEFIVMREIPKWAEIIYEAANLVEYLTNGRGCTFYTKESNARKRWIWNALLMASPVEYITIDKIQLMAHNYVMAGEMVAALNLPLPDGKERAGSGLTVDAIASNGNFHVDYLFPRNSILEYSDDFRYSKTYKVTDLTNTNSVV